MHSVAKFMAHCLQTDAPPVTPVVMATWVFVCRQLYKVGAGLVAMETYQLHTHIANLIKKVRNVTSGWFVMLTSINCFVSWEWKRSKFSWVGVASS